MYKFKIQMDLGLSYVDDPSARAKAEDLLSAIQELISHCPGAYPVIEKATLIDEDRKDGFNILSKMNAQLAEEAETRRRMRDIEVAQRRQQTSV